MPTTFDAKVNNNHNNKLKRRTTSTTIAKTNSCSNTMLPRTASPRPTSKWSRLFEPAPSVGTSTKPSFFRRRQLVIIGFVVFCVMLLALGGPSSSSLSSFSFNSNSLASNSNNQDSSSSISSSGGVCKVPKDRNPQQYALMIDAGSTGSRIHIYRFKVCEGSMPVLEHESFHSLLPGLSSFANDPRAAFDSLKPLLDAAVEEVPKQVQHCTPISVKATAGLRLLGDDQSQAIIDQVESGLRNEWPFAVAGQPSSGEGVGIMDGKDEGVFAWITINYLNSNTNNDKTTAAVMDLGGASTQIVFEPSFPGAQRIREGEHVYELHFSDAQHTLYQHSHLGYGLMQARRAVHNLAGYTWLWGGQGSRDWDQLGQDDEIASPCMVKDSRKRVLLDPPGRNPVNVTIVGTGTGFDGCKRLVDVIMAKDTFCEADPCAFGGVYQPSLMETFQKGPIYALSYFYDRLIPLGLGVNNEPFSISDLENLAKDVCKGPDGENGWDRFENASPDAVAELDDRPEYCLDLTFMHSLLSLGYDLAQDRQVRVAKKIDDIELGWALGATIAMLDSDIYCKA